MKTNTKIKWELCTKLSSIHYSMCVCVWLHARLCVRACVWLCARACVRECGYVCLCDVTYLLPHTRWQCLTTKQNSLFDVWLCYLPIFSFKYMCMLKRNVLVYSIYLKLNRLWPVLDCFKTVFLCFSFLSFSASLVCFFLCLRQLCVSFSV